MGSMLWKFNGVFGMLSEGLGPKALVSGLCKGTGCKWSRQPAGTLTGTLTGLLQPPKLGFGTLQQSYLEGQGDLVSRLITPTTHIVTLVIPCRTNLLSAPDPTSRVP